MDSENLKICFLILVGNRFYSEGELATRLTEMKEAAQTGVIDPITTDGAISIVYNLEELLGVEFWNTVNYISAQPHDLLEGKSRDEYLSYQTCWLHFRPIHNRLLFEVDSRAKSRPWHLKRSLPLISFVKEWTLMSLRLQKFMAYINNNDNQRLKDYWNDSALMTEKLRHIITQKYFQYIVESDLATVLAESGCTQGYFYEEEKGYIEVV